MKKRDTKRSLIASIMSLVLCITMLLGTTLAWFTDSVSSGVNKIQAGNLDIEVSYEKSENNWVSIQDVDTLFNKEALWEPGHTEFVTLKVENKGTLALKYKMDVSPISENGGINVYGDAFKLSDYLKFGTTISNVDPNYTDRAEARASISQDNYGLHQAGLQQNRELAPEAEEYITLVVYMPEEVDNKANYKTGTPAPKIELGITVLATQKESENDSFGSDYDKEAGLAREYVAGPYYEFFQAVNTSGTSDENHEFTVNSSSSASTVDQNNTVKVTGTTENAGDTVTVSVVKTDTPDGIAVSENKNAVAYEVKVTGQAENSEVWVELYVGTALEEFDFYHNENLMTNVGSVNELSDGKYYYDSASGVVTFVTKSFSPFTGVFKDAAATIVNDNGTAMYGTLEAAVKAANDGDTVKLLKDCAGNGIGLYVNAQGDKIPCKNLTIDFNSYTYEIDGETQGSEGTKTQAFHLEKGSNVTLKNGTIVSSKAIMLIQNYCDMTLENMTLDGTQIPGTGRYVLSNNFGEVNICGNTNIIAKDGDVAFDVYYWPKNSYADGVMVTVNTTGTIQGKIEYGSDGSETALADISNKAKLILQNGKFVNTSLSVYNCGNNIPNIIKANNVNISAPDGFEWNQEGGLVEKSDGSIPVHNVTELYEAINTINDSENRTGIIKFKSDIIENAEMESTYAFSFSPLNYNASITIDMNGYNFSNTKSGAFMYLDGYDGSKLIICNSSDEKSKIERIDENGNGISTLFKLGNVDLELRGNIELAYAYPTFDVFHSSTHTIKVEKTVKQLCKESLQFSFHYNGNPNPGDAYALTTIDDEENDVTIYTVKYNY